MLPLHYSLFSDYNRNIEQQFPLIQKRGFEMSAIDKVIKEEYIGKLVQILKELDEKQLRYLISFIPARFPKTK